MSTLTLRASQTNRAFNCAGSVRMESQVPVPPDSDDAKEGTAAHWVAEMVLTNVVSDSSELVDRQAPNGVMITGVMTENVDWYIRRIRGRGIPFSVEQPVSVLLSNDPHVVIEGTGDAISYDDSTATLYVDDLKYGYRLVDAVGNWQLISYALGALSSGQYNMAERFVLTIDQPRPYHPAGKVRSWELSRDDLMGYYRKIQELVSLIMSPDAMLTTGLHCGYCAAFDSCPAAQSAGMNAVDVATRAFVDILDGGALNMELVNLNRAKTMIENRLSAMQELAESRLRSGTPVPGWSLQPRLGNTEWIDGVDMSTMEMIAGKPLTISKPITPAAAKREGVPEDMVKAFTTRPSRGMKLVQMDIDEQARKVFK